MILAACCSKSLSNARKLFAVIRSFNSQQATKNVHALCIQLFQHVILTPIFLYLLQETVVVRNAMPFTDYSQDRGIFYLIFGDNKRTPNMTTTVNLNIHSAFYR